MVDALNLRTVSSHLRVVGEPDYADIVSDAADELTALRRRLEDAQAENRRLHAIELQVTTPARRGAHW